MYYEVNAKALLLKAANEFINYRDSNLAVSRLEVADLNKIYIANKKFEDLFAIVSLAKSERIKFLGDRDERLYEKSLKEHLLSEFKKYIRNNLDIAELKKEEEEIWKLFLTRASKLENSGRTSESDPFWNIKHLKKAVEMGYDENDIVEISFDLDNLTTNISNDSLLVLNKLLNLYSEDIHQKIVLPGDDKTILIKSNNTLSDLESILETSVQEISFDESDVISNHFFDNPLDIKELFKEVEKLGLESTENADNEFSDRNKRLSAIEVFDILNKLSSEDLKDYDVCSDVLDLSLEVMGRVGGDESIKIRTLSEIKSMNRLYFASKNEIPVLSIKEFPVDFLKVPGNIEKVLEYLGYMHSVNIGGRDKNYGAVDALGYKSDSGKCFFDFISENKNVLLAFNESQKIDLNLKPLGIWASILDVYGENIAEILDYFNKNQGTQKQEITTMSEIMTLVSFLHLKNEVPKLKDVSSFLSLSDKYNNMETSKEILLSLFKDEEIAENSEALHVLYRSFTVKKYSSEVTKFHEGFMNRNIHKMLQNYIDGSNDFKDDMLFMFEESISSDINMVQKTSMFTKHYVELLSNLDQTMKDSPIVYNNKEYSDLRVLLDDFYDDKGRLLLLANAMNYLVKISDHTKFMRSSEYVYFSITGVKSETPMEECALVAKKNFSLENIKDLYVEIMKIVDTPDNKKDLSKMGRPSILTLLNEPNKYRDFILNSLKKYLNTDCFTEEQMMEVKESLVKEKHILFQIMKNKNNLRGLSAILDDVEPSFWDELVDGYDDKKILGIFFGDKDFLKNVSKSKFTKEFLNDLIDLSLEQKVINFNINMGNQDVPKFTNEQLSYDCVKEVIIRKLNAKQSSKIYGLAELLKPKNLLLLADAVEDGSKDMSVFSYLSKDLGDFIEKNNLNKGNVKEHFNILFNSIVMEKAIPVKKTRTKLFKM